MPEAKSPGGEILGEQAMRAMLEWGDCASLGQPIWEAHLSTHLLVAEEEESVNHIMAALSGQKVIRIDGHSGMGKSRIAKEIARLFGWKRIEGDQFLDQPRNGRLYFEQVKKDEFLAAAREALETGQGIVLDAICLDWIIEPNVLGPELRVYMESVTPPEFHEDDAARNKQLGSDVYHEQVDPKGKADVVIQKFAKF